MTRTSLSLRQSLPARRTGYPADIGLVARRALAPPGTPTPCASEVIGGVPCVIVGESRGDATVVHLHGGGYRMGCARDWAGFGNELSRSTGARVILPEYSLAPEHPFPGAIHDVIGLIGALVGADEEKPILLSGDSAGGGLALAVASLLADPGRLAGIILISPWLDLRLTADSYGRCAATDTIFPPTSAQASATDYLQGWPAQDPLASPLLGNLRGLPPICLFASGAEVLADDALGLVERIGAAGGGMSFCMPPDLLHDWPVVDPDRRETALVFDLIEIFARQVLPSV
jgi:acetyl esterase/lipase